MSLPDSLTLGSTTYERTDFGSFVDSSSSLDEPRNLHIEQSLSADGESSFVVKVKGTKNSPTAGDPDINYQYHTVVKFDTGVTEAEILAGVGEVSQLITDTGNLTKILQGRR